jgi:hypothetical protein
MKGTHNISLLWFVGSSPLGTMKASIVVTLFVGFASISLCEGFTSWVRNPAAALSHRALHSTQASVQETSQEPSLEKVILLKQAEKYLGSSNLVYLYAELRQLSYCGYTKTKFSEFDCNQDDQFISGYKLLDTLLKERTNVINCTVDPENSYRRSYRR